MLAIAVLTAGLLRAVMENRAPARRAGARFSITARSSPAVSTAIASIRADAWTPIHYPNAVWDEAEQRLISVAGAARAIWRIPAHRVRLRRHLRSGPHRRRADITRHSLPRVQEGSRTPGIPHRIIRSGRRRQDTSARQPPPTGHAVAAAARQRNRPGTP